MWRKPLGFQTWQTAGRKQETGNKRQETGKSDRRDSVDCSEVSVTTYPSAAKKISFSVMIVCSFSCSHWPQSLQQRHQPASGAASWKFCHPGDFQSQGTESCQTSPGKVACWQPGAGCRSPGSTFGGLFLQNRRERQLLHREDGLVEIGPVDFRFLVHRQ